MFKSLYRIPSSFLPEILFHLFQIERIHSPNNMESRAKLRFKLRNKARLNRGVVYVSGSVIEPRAEAETVRNELAT